MAELFRDAYADMLSAHQSIGAEKVGLIPDPNAQNKGGLIVAVTFREADAGHMAERGAIVADMLDSARDPDADEPKTVRYDGSNLHSTFYPLEVQDGPMPDDRNLEEGVVAAVTRGLDTAGRDIRAYQGILFSRFVTNQRGAVAAGMPTGETQHLKVVIGKAIEEQGLDLWAPPKPQSGNHASIARYTRFVEPRVARNVVRELDASAPPGDGDRDIDAPRSNAGLVVPKSIIVARFGITHETGFVREIVEEWDFRPSVFAVGAAAVREPDGVTRKVQETRSES